MCAADEVSLMDAMHGAAVLALSAADTFFVIDHGEVVFHVDRVFGAILFAFSATDTTLDTRLADGGAFIVVGTLDDDFHGVVDKMNDMVGAFTCADAASHALAGIDVSHALLDADRVMRADSRAIAVAEASEGAESVAGKCHIGGFTGLGTVVFELAASFTVAVTSDVSDLFHDVCGFHAEDVGDTLRGSVTAGNAEVRLIRFALGKGCRIAVATGETAGTAVGTGEALADGFRLFVLFYGEEHGGDRQKHRAKDGGDTENKNGR